MQEDRLGAMVVDTDVHHGNGTAATSAIRRSSRRFTSITTIRSSPASDLDIHLEMAGDNALPAVEAACKQAMMSPPAT
jgi:acetoin utilization deacetylase AcuC-like enzyme